MNTYVIRKTNQPGTYIDQIKADGFYVKDGLVVFQDLPTQKFANFETVAIVSLEPGTMVELQ